MLIFNICSIFSCVNVPCLLTCFPLGGYWSSFRYLGLSWLIRKRRLSITDLCFHRFLFCLVILLKTGRPVHVTNLIQNLRFSQEPEDLLRGSCLLSHLPFACPVLLCRPSAHQCPHVALTARPALVISLSVCSSVLEDKPQLVRISLFIQGLYQSGTSSNPESPTSSFWQVGFLTVKHAKWSRTPAVWMPVSSNV